VRRTPWSGRALDVDVVLDLMIHDIDLVLTLAGAPVVSVAATGVSVATAFNDVVEARVTFANGVVATLAASRVAAAPERIMSVIEDGRRLTADLGRAELAVATPAAAGGIAEERITLPRADNLAAEVDAFLASIATGAPPPVDGRAGLDALRLAEAILDAAGRRPADAPSHGVRV
jgi:predicted dehydrogenase